MTNADTLTVNVVKFLKEHGYNDTAAHCLKVAEQARKVAERFHANAEAAYIAGLLHDVSAIYPNEDRIRVAREKNIEVLPEEEAFPMIIHQKISKSMAREQFHIQNPYILNAIECHTTLKSNATILDRVLFVADKISWDQNGTPPYLPSLHHGLSISLEHGAFAYIQYLWERKDTLRVIHPWLEQAYFELCSTLQLET